jgi:hypothetical protein
MYKCYAPCIHYVCQFFDRAVVLINLYHLMPYTCYKWKMLCVHISFILSTLKIAKFPLQYSWPKSQIRKPYYKGMYILFLYLFNSDSRGWSLTGPTRHVGHQVTYCNCPEWLWRCRIWWNDNWQRKPKFSKKICPSATLSTTNPTWPDGAGTRAAVLGSQRLTA